MAPASGDYTRAQLLAAAEAVLHKHGYAGLSTRRVAEQAGVPLSQIHYHFGSKGGLVISVFEYQNEKLLGRQTEMFGSAIPLWKQWEQACNFLDDDLASGYVRILQELIAAGWSDPDIAAAVRPQLARWSKVLASVARDAADRFDGLGPFSPDELGALVSAAFLGAEQGILLGITEEELPLKSALRKVGDVIRTLEEETR